MKKIDATKLIRTLKKLSHLHFQAGQRMMGEIAKGKKTIAQNHSDMIRAEAKKNQIEEIIQIVEEMGGGK